MVATNDTCSSPEMRVELAESSTEQPSQRQDDANELPLPPSTGKDTAIPDIIGDSPTATTSVISIDEDSTEEVSARFWHQLGFSSDTDTDTSGHHAERSSGSTSILGESLDMSHFHRQVTRVVDFVMTEKINHEMCAKAILADLIKQSPERKPVSQACLQKVDGLINSYKVLEKYASNMANVLANMGCEVDEKRNYDCLGQSRSATPPSAVTLLQRELDGANRSSAFLVVLSDIFEVARVASAEQSKVGDETQLSSKWVAPTSFQRSTSKYW
jgi:hypothetical protein